MTRRFRRAAAAELVKLITLPAVLGAGLGTIGAAVGLAAVFAASADGDADLASIMTGSMAFLQIGPILLGVLAAATEYTGNQIRTTLTAVPSRGVALTSKAVAYLATALVTSAAALAAGFTTAWIGVDRGAAATWTAVPLLAAASGYLVLIGLLALTVAVLLRSLVAALVAVLGLVLIVSPLLGSITEHGRWLPDRAGQLLYRTDTDPVLTPGSGALVLLAWITAVGLAAGASFRWRDA